LRNFCTSAASRGASRALRQQRFGPLAELLARLPLAERFPALELGQLLDEPADPLHRGLRQHAGVRFRGADLVRGRARRMQLSGCERLLGRVQQRVHVRAGLRRRLLRRLDLREPALLDHDQRGLEALRERRTAHRAVERAPALRKARIVDRSVGRELLRLDDQRFGPGRRVAFPRPAGDPCFRFVEHRKRCRVVAACRNVAQRRELAALQFECLCIGRRLQRVDPLAQSPIELRARAVLVALAVEPRLHDCACGIPACAARLVVGEVERLPPAIDVDDRADDGTRLRGKRVELLQQRIGCFLLAFAPLDRIDSMAGKARHAAILVLRGLRPSCARPSGSSRAPRLLRVSA
jgi:hypothetical protein